MIDKALPDFHTFVQNLGQQFNDPITEGLHPATLFRGLKDWTSLQALIVISSFDWDYGVTFSSEDLKKAKTIGDLFEQVTQKMGGQ
jgi:acyl carrier protein